MKPMSLNLSQMKKVGGDNRSSTFMHPSGHKIVIAHHGVSALQRKQMERMPVQKMADGGEIKDIDLNDPKDIDLNETPDTPAQSGKFIDSQIDAPTTSLTPMPANNQTGAVPLDQANSDQMQVTPGPLMASVDRGMPDSVPSDVSPELQNNQTQASQQAPGMPQLADVGGAYQQGQRAISEQQAIDSAKSKSDADIQSKDIADRETLNKNFQDLQKEFSTHQQQYMQDYMNNHVDPKHYQESMSTGSKVATGIGLLLGGMSAGTLGGPNPAMEMLNKQIDRDIKSQESRIDQQKTLLGANQELYHDKALAMNQTRINMNDMYDHRIQLAAAKLGTPQAKANADAAHAKFTIENAQLLNQNTMRAAAFKSSGDGSVDPARLVPFLVPKEHQAKAFGEIEAAEDTRKMSGDILKNFEDAAKENTIIKTGGGYLRTPGSVYALHQAMQPTFKDLEGTVRQAAMDNTFKNITPMPGDSDHKIQQKREALQGYLQSKLSAPTARGYGIDLGRFHSTAPASAPVQQVVKSMNGVKYVQVPGGWKKAQ